MPVDLVLLGAGGLARETLEAVRAAGSHRPVALLDDDDGLHGTTVGGVAVAGRVEEVDRFPTAEVVACPGRGPARGAVLARAEARGAGAGRLGTVVHPAASVGATCVVGPGSVLLAHVVLTADVRLGRSVVVMPGAVLTHDVVVDDLATVCAGVMLAGGVHVGQRSYLGAGCSIRQGARIGEGSVVGMGAVVLDDVPAGETWVGVPARPLSRRDVVVP